MVAAATDRKHVDDDDDKRMPVFYIRMPKELASAVMAIARDEAATQSERPNWAKTVRQIVFREAVKRGYLARPRPPRLPARTATSKKRKTATVRRARTRA